MSPQNFEFVQVEPPSRPAPSTQRAYRKMKWAEYPPETASGATKPAIDARSVASKNPLDKLKISAEQRAALEEVYSPSLPYRVVVVAPGRSFIQSRRCESAQCSNYGSA